MAKGTIQSSSDSIDMGQSPVRPPDSAKSSGGELQYGGADHIELGMNGIRPPYSDPGSKGTVQMGGADEVQLKKGGSNFAFENQVSGVKSTAPSD